MKRIIALIAFAVCSFTQAAFANNIIPQALVGQWFFNGIVPGVKYSTVPELITFNQDGSYTDVSGFFSDQGAIRVDCLVTDQGTIKDITQKGPDAYELVGDAKSVPGSIFPLPGSTMNNCVKADGGFTSTIHFNISNIKEGSFTIGDSTFIKR